MKNLLIENINGRYQLIEKIGAGGIGDVFLAQDLKLSRKVAIKVVRQELLKNEEVRNRIDRECLLHASLEHPNIVTFHDKIVTHGNTHIVLEYVSGETLASFIKRSVEDGQGLSHEVVVSIVLQILDALTLIHQHNIIHRDIKPSNIMLQKLSTGRLLAKLMDFGIAAVEMGDETLTKITSLSTGDPGTPAYMAPERFDSENFDSPGPASDLYSVGTVIYEMLVGSPPFVGTMTEVVTKHLLKEPDWGKIPSHTPQLLTNIAQKALSKRSALRYQSALEFSVELRDFLLHIDNLSSLDPEKTVLSTPSATDIFTKGNSQPSPQAPEGILVSRLSPQLLAFIKFGGVCVVIFLLTIVPNVLDIPKIQRENVSLDSSSNNNEQHPAIQVENQISSLPVTHANTSGDEKVLEEVSPKPQKDQGRSNKQSEVSKTVRSSKAIEAVGGEKKNKDSNLLQNQGTVEKQTGKESNDSVFERYSWQSSTGPKENEQNLNSAIHEFVAARKALTNNQAPSVKNTTIANKTQKTTTKPLKPIVQNSWKATSNKTAGSSKCSTLLKSYQLGDSSGIQEYIRTCSQ